MKNLMLYTSPARRLDEEHTTLVKIQIDNSLELGWKREDILLVTNFSYEYQGVKALVIGDFYYEGDKTSNKVPVIRYLLDKGLIVDELHWYHDIDAYQNNVIKESELGLDGFDMGLTTYGYKPHWNCGSFFFRKNTKDIFDLWYNKIVRRKRRTRADEKALKKLTDYGIIDSRRYKVLDMTYNFQYLYLPRHYYYDRAIKPLKVLHFHPYWTLKQDSRMFGTALDVFMYGRGKLPFPLMSEGLIKVFNKHGIQ